jgi:hypothetical protein
MTVVKYALDVPRGAKIIAPATYAGIPLAGGIIAEVRYVDRGALLVFADGGSRPIGTTALLTVDLDTPERRDRLAFADQVLSR